MTGTVATRFSAAFRPSPPRGMIRSTSPSCVGQLGELLAPAAGDERDRALGQARRRAASAAIAASTALECAARRRAAQHDRVAGLQAQRGGVDRDVRPRLVDDGDDAERHAHLAHVQPVGQPAAVDDLADRVGQRGDLAHAGGDRRRRAPRRASGGRAARRASPASRPASRSRALASRISSARALERVGDRVQRARPCRRVERGEPARRARPRAQTSATDERRDGHATRVARLRRARSSRGARPPRSPAAAARAPRRDFMPGTRRSSSAE